MSDRKMIHTTTKSIRLPSIVLIFLVFDISDIGCNKTDSIWIEAGRMTSLLLHNCMQQGLNGPQEQFLVILQRCLKRRSLLILDRSLDRDVIELANGIELVKYRQENDTQDVLDSNSKARLIDLDWKSNVLNRIADVLNSHVLKLQFNDNQPLKPEARRRRRHMMMSVMMFGMVALGMIVIPMGFQFLAVLGGKALLLAKMALILTSIQGLKKIATSNVNYGLYSTPTHGHWHYDRQWPFELEGQEPGFPYFYDVPDKHTDLLHPLHPRFDIYKTKMYTDE